MRIRLPFLVTFVFLLVLASSAGLLPHSVLPSAPASAQPYIPPQSDKLLHFLTFFALTASFYFILDTTRRRQLHLTLIVCTVLLGVGSEVAQGLLPNDREWDLWDVVANVIGSGLAVSLCTIYHKRQLERRRKMRYEAVLGEGEDVELADNENGIPRRRLDDIEAVPSSPPVTQPKKTVEEELDNWDEHAADDWDEDEDGGVPGVKTVHKITPPVGDKKIAVD